MKIDTIKFKNHPILGNLELNFRKSDGDIYENIVLVGENGCGKTSILKQINNYEDSVFIDKKKQKVTIAGKGKFKSVLIPQDIKYSKAMEAISNRTLGGVPNKINNVLGDNNLDLLTNNHINSNVAFLDKIKEFNNNILIDKFSNNSINNENAMEYVEGLVGIIKQPNKNIVDDMSSGEQELFLRLQNLRNIISLDTDFILIDEPETSLHPKWQLKIFAFLKDLFKECNNERNVQLFIATHSENILKTVLDDNNTLIIRLFKDDEQIIHAESITEMDRVISYVSFPETQYIVFDIPSRDYHNQLYGQLQEKLQKNVKKTDDYIIKSKFYNKAKHEKCYINGEIEYKSLPTYIRNVIHHPEDNKYQFTNKELNISITLLRDILKNFNT